MNFNKRDGTAGTFAAGLLVLLGAAPVLAACNTDISMSRPDSRYEAVANASPTGSEVRDKVTGLIWQRCARGMSWNGSTCAGTATRVAWAQTLEVTRTSPASVADSSDPWRLPNLAELQSLVELACFGPAINTTWFPATANAVFWSSSQHQTLTTQAWVVNFSEGGTEDYGKSSTARMRLVRSGQ